MRKVLLALLLALSACLAGGTAIFAQAPPAAAGSPEQAAGTSPATTFKVDVKLVNVFATVVDEHGTPVPGLTKDDFEVREDGRPQRIAVFDRESGLPLSIVVAIDTSLSTRKDIHLELDSAKRFVHSILRHQDAVAVYQFSEYVDELVPFTANLERIDHGIARARVGAATALYDAIYLGGHALLNRQGRKVMVLITDGGDTASKIDFQDAVRASQEAEAIVYSIIIVPIEASAGRNTGGEHALIDLSQETGGKYFYAGNLEALDAAFHQISDELRTQYMLSYYPSEKLAESDYRRIEVKVKPSAERSGPLTVRHRTGYYTSKAE